MEDIEDIGLAVFIAVYWFSGSYVFAWWTPFTLQAGLLGMVIGLVLFAWSQLIEARGDKTPPLLGLLLFAPPLSLMLVGAIFWVLEQLVSPP